MDHCLWMYNMHYKKGVCLQVEFIDGVSILLNIQEQLKFSKMNWLGVLVVHVGA